MKKEEILAMEAGKELDKLIAENVMKWQMYHYDKDHAVNCYYMLVDENFDAVANDVTFTWRNGERKTEDEAWKDNKFWSTDISAAWEVLEQFHTYQITKMHNVDSEKETKYRAIVKANKNAAYAETAELAICKAALLAVMEETT